MSNQSGALAHRFSELILEASGDGVYGVDTQGHTMFVNPAAVRMCGFTLEEMVGRSQHDLTHHTRADGRPYPASECPIYAAFRDGKVHRDDVEVFWRKDGTSFPVEYVSTPIIDDGEIVGAVISFRDITRRKAAEVALEDSRERARKLQAELNHVSRLSAMGELASGLAHELNQPLTAISNYIRAAQRHLAGDRKNAEGKAREMLDKAAAQTHRAGDIIRGMRQFVSKADSVQSFENIGAVVREAVSLAAAGSRAQNTTISADGVRDLPPILVDKIRIQQVVVNLVRNAVEAIGPAESGRVDVRAAPCPGGAEVAVCDNGPGLSAEVKDRLFQSFVTSKASGMGVGLSICRSIIEDHGGRLFAEENDGGGMTFRFTLPGQPDQASG